MYHILVCDDDKDIVSALEIYLRGDGYDPIPAYDGRQALQIVEEQQIDLILLDVMMPQLDGIRATAHLRQDYNIPIILLTAKSEDNDKILGLNIGADDYITKPFNPLEVLARVRSQLRRYTQLGGQGTLPEDVLVCGPLTLDTATKRLTLDGENVDITPTEYRILALMMAHPGQVFSAGQIYENVWKEDSMVGSDNTVAVHIRHIREKVEVDPAHPRYLKVIWGLGYKIEPDPPAKTGKLRR